MRPQADVSAAPDPDVVYFLMFEGWGKELQANRWHWAKRWSRTLPVVLVQPSQPRAPRSLQSRPELRLPNVRVLQVKSQGLRRRESDAEIAVGQLSADLAQHGFQRPLLWSYNPL